MVLVEEVDNIILVASAVELDDVDWQVPWYLVPVHGLMSVMSSDSGASVAMGVKRFCVGTGEGVCVEVVTTARFLPVGAVFVLGFAGWAIFHGFSVLSALASSMRTVPQC